MKFKTNIKITVSGLILVSSFAWSQEINKPNQNCTIYFNKEVIGTGGITNEVIGTGGITNEVIGTGGITNEVIGTGGITNEVNVTRGVSVLCTKEVIGTGG